MLTQRQTSPLQKSAPWIDAMVLLALLALVFGAAEVSAQWRHPLRQTVEIDLSPAALLKYSLFSFARGWIAYFFSLLFTLLVASWAFYDLRARRFVLPALDVLQSIPVLGFLPGLELGLVGLFPHSNVGLELACVLSIFTGQVWNMVFSYYDSLRGTPADFRMLGRLYGFSWWHRFWRIELPFGAQGLLYNSMVSMAGGWFFLSVSEAFSLGNKDFRVPGIGSYMSVAIERGDVRAQIYGIFAMGLVIVVVDRLIWWPLVLWSRKFKLDDFGTGLREASALQLWLARSVAAQKIAAALHALGEKMVRPACPPSEATSLVAPGAAVRPARRHWVGRGVYLVFMIALAFLLAWGALHVAALLRNVHAADWLEILRDAAASFARVLASVFVGTLWTVPLGVWIGLNPRLASKLQPFIQFAASFPAPMLYPWLLALVLAAGGSLQWGAVLLILFGTQWYILFNVAASAAAIPNDIVSCAEILRLNGWNRWTRFLIPAVLPGLVTGWITAAGGAWNATIVSEYVGAWGKLYEATGLGDYISRASADGNFPRLAAAVLVMAAIVVTINRSLWKRLQNLANARCRFEA
jgi:NitT/TauT family transport system permease protein